MLTKDERNILGQMMIGHILIEATPGGWWLENERVDGRIGWALLRKVLISEISGLSQKNYHNYRINERGRDALGWDGKAIA